MNTQILPYSNDTQLWSVISSFCFDVLSKIKHSLFFFLVSPLILHDVVGAARLVLFPLVCVHPPRQYFFFTLLSSSARYFKILLAQPGCGSAKSIMLSIQPKTCWLRDPAERRPVHSDRLQSPLSVFPLLFQSDYFGCVQPLLTYVLILLKSRH